jgi:hypothetical protein
MSRLEIRQLGKVHITSFVNPGFAVRAVGGELVAEIRQPRLPAITLDQPSDGYAAVASAPAAADFEETGVKVAEGERAFMTRRLLVQRRYPVESLPPRRCLERGRVAARLPRLRRCRAAPEGVRLRGNLVRRDQTGLASRGGADSEIHASQLRS